MEQIRVSGEGLKHQFAGRDFLKDTATEDQGNADETIEDPVTKALSNGLILGSVFRNGWHQYPFLKPSRLVCRLWNSTILSLNPPRLIANVFGCSRGVQVSKCVNANIVRAVRVYELKCEPDSKFWDNYGEFIHVIDMHIELSKIGDLFRIVTNFCPKLATLCVNISCIQNIYISECEFSDVAENLTRVQPGLSSNLRSIKITSAEMLKSEFEKKLWPSLSNFVQCLIDTAPNLDTLRIEDNFYPNLGKLKTLKVLEHWAKATRTTSEGDETGNETFSIPELVRMVTQVRSSLEKLQLNLLTPIWCYDEYHLQSDLFELPPLPKLRSLHTGVVGFYPLGRGFKNIQSSRLPSLQYLHLRLTCNGIPILEKLFQDKAANYLYKHEGVKSLHIGDDVLPLLLRVKTAFPNLQNLWVGFWHLNAEGAQTLFEKIFSRCAVLNLVRLRIDVAFDFDLAQMLAAWETAGKPLFGSGTLRCLQIFKTGYPIWPPVGHFEGEKGTEADNDLENRWGDLLLEIKIPKLILRNFMWRKRGYTNRVLDVVMKNKLPVLFPIDIALTRVKQGEPYWDLPPALEPAVYQYGSNKGSP